MERYIKPHILVDLPKKIILVTGPRQAGKTTLAKQLVTDYDYFNYDAAEDRIAIANKSWDRQKKLIIFDELHKKSDWKRWLKGIYDTEGIPPQLLVTGSAKLDTYRKLGDSLAGRYFQFRLLPLDMKEAHQQLKFSMDNIFERLNSCSGFPEPFTVGDETFYRRWRRSHLDIILRQDLMDIHTIRDIKSIETLVALLRQRVGSGISYANLARDLECDAKTIKRWLELLENLYVIFKVTPYHKNIARSLLKEPKYYFYDQAYANISTGAGLENLVAFSLLKEIKYIEDITGISGSLHYLRTKEGKEIDFLVVFDDTAVLMLEVKHKDAEPSTNFATFENYFPNISKLQLVKQLEREKTYPSGLQIRELLPWLTKIDLASMLEK